MLRLIGVGWLLAVSACAATCFGQGTWDALGEGLRVVTLLLEEGLINGDA